SAPTDRPRSRSGGSRYSPGTQGRSRRLRWRPMAGVRARFAPGIFLFALDLSRNRKIMIWLGALSRKVHSGTPPARGPGEAVCAWPSARDGALLLAFAAPLPPCAGVATFFLHVTPLTLGSATAAWRPAMKQYVAVGIAVVAGAALIEAALIPGLVIGGAAVLAPNLLPKALPGLLRRRKPRPAPSRRSNAPAAGQALVKSQTSLLPRFA